MRYTDENYKCKCPMRQNSWCYNQYMGISCMDDDIDTCILKKSDELEVKVNE